MERRTFLKTALGASTAAALGFAPRLVRAAEPPTEAKPWRSFEAVTKIEVANPTGITRVWVPVPLLTDTDYFKRGGDTWTGNAAVTRSVKADKARALYEWIVENTFRDPKVRGCGLGDIKTMLDTRYFGGKCADLNALFVGLARAVKIPARDVYGARCADSAEFKSLGKSGDISKAQHCRAEFYLNGYGWVPVDPADVRKVILEEGG